jgi:c-di-GMP-related signal transduction protein
MNLRANRTDGPEGEPLLSVLVARQPILDIHQRTVAYELLFRSSADNRFDATEGSEATNAVLSGAFLNIGAHRLLAEKRGWVNFTRALLLEDVALALPREDIVVEVLEDVECGPEVIRACERLKAAGYILALDDITTAIALSPLSRYADYAKIDWRAGSAGDREELCALCQNKGLRLLAEKVETRADVAAARSLGCELFQGYFFARPEIVSARKVPASSLACLRLLKEIQSGELNFERLEAIVSKDVGLSQRLLFFVNSAAFSHHAQIESLRQAMSYLGEDRVAQWVTLAAIPRLAAGKPIELITLSLVRARFCELVAEDSRLPYRHSSPFLVGLLSLIDVLVGLPLEELIAELGLEAHIANAILGSAGRVDSLRLVLELSVALERSDLEGARRLAKSLGIPISKTGELYMNAMAWADAVQREP